MVYTITMTLEANLKTQQHIGKKLREMRERKNLSQGEVASASEISLYYYGGIERGEENPTITVLENICKVLKIKSSDILPF